MASIANIYKDIFAYSAHTNFMKEKFIRFIAYGLIGWCLEILWTGLGSLIQGNFMLYSFTYMWMFLIYGIGVYMEPIHNKIRDWNVYIRGGVWVLIIFTIEYLCGWALDIMLGQCPWDYGNGILSINGYIRLDFTIAWFFTGLLYERVHDFLIAFQKLPKDQSIHSTPLLSGYSLLQNSPEQAAEYSHKKD